MKHYINPLEKKSYNNKYQQDNQYKNNYNIKNNINTNYRYNKKEIEKDDQLYHYSQKYRQNIKQPNNKINRNSKSKSKNKFNPNKKRYLQDQRFGQWIQNSSQLSSVAIGQLPSQSNSDRIKGRGSNQQSSSQSSYKKQSRYMFGNKYNQNTQISQSRQKLESYGAKVNCYALSNLNNNHDKYNNYNKNQHYYNNNYYKNTNSKNQKNYKEIKKQPFSYYKSKKLNNQNNKQIQIQKQKQKFIPTPSFGQKNQFNNTNINQVSNYNVNNNLNVINSNSDINSQRENFHQNKNQQKKISKSLYKSYSKPLNSILEKKYNNSLKNSRDSGDNSSINSHGKNRFNKYYSQSLRNNRNFSQNSSNQKRQPYRYRKITDNQQHQKYLNNQNKYQTSSLYSPSYNFNSNIWFLIKNHVNQSNNSINYSLKTIKQSIEKYVFNQSNNSQLQVYNNQKHLYSLIKYFQENLSPLSQKNSIYFIFTSNSFSQDKVLKESKFYNKCFYVLIGGRIQKAQFFDTKTIKIPYLNNYFIQEMIEKVKKYKLKGNSQTYNINKNSQNNFYNSNEYKNTNLIYKSPSAKQQQNQQRIFNNKYPNAQKKTASINQRNNSGNSIDLSSKSSNKKVTFSSQIDQILYSSDNVQKNQKKSKQWKIIKRSPLKNSQQRIDDPKYKNQGQAIKINQYAKTNKSVQDKKKNSIQKQFSKIQKNQNSTSNQNQSSNIKNNKQYYSQRPIVNKQSTATVSEFAFNPQKKIMRVFFHSSLHNYSQAIQNKLLSMNQDFKIQTFQTIQQVEKCIQSQKNPEKYNNILFISLELGKEKIKNELFVKMAKIHHKNTIVKPNEVNDFLKFLKPFLN